jgi:hypothetical protein
MVAVLDSANAGGVMRTDNDKMLILTQLLEDLKLIKDEALNREIDSYCLVVLSKDKASGELSSISCSSSLHIATLLGFLEISKTNLINQLHEEH